MDVSFLGIVTRDSINLLLTNELQYLHGIQIAYITCCYVWQAFRFSRTTFFLKVCIKFEYVSEKVY